ncbi:hypothetical protein D3C75_1233640 [compost metagenome]
MRMAFCGVMISATTPELQAASAAARPYTVNTSADCAGVNPISVMCLDRKAISKPSPLMKMAMAM